MSHAATLNRLAEGFITAATGRTNTDPSFRKLRDQTLRGLKDQSHARTNQFAVKDSLDGLIEKFTVLNREDLAETLEERLLELPTQSKWMPEYLSLLLELSDKPAEKTNLEDVLNANKVENEEPALTWDDIITDDPLDEPDIWDDVERGYHSSEDDRAERDEDSEPTISTKATSLHEDDPVAIARLHLIQPDEAAVSRVKELRDRWQSSSPGNHAMELSELAIVREILSMLHGIPTDFFKLHESTGEVSLSAEAQLGNTSRSSISSLLHTSARLGTAMNFLRVWKTTSHRASYLQSMAAAIEHLLATFGRQLSSVEGQLIDPAEDLVVSANLILTQALELTTPLAHLSSLIRRASKVPQEHHPFVLIDLLDEEANLAQMSGNQATFEALASVFISGLETYLRSVTAWIELGSLYMADSNFFFVQEHSTKCEAGDLWRAQFEIRKDPNGNAVLPSCLATFADQIFALGKAKSFLQRLQTRGDATKDAEYLAHGPTLLGEVRKAVQQASLISFSQLLNDTLEDWLYGVQAKDTVSLVQMIQGEYGLNDTLSAIPYVFFSKDGTLFEGFAQDLYGRFAKTMESTTSNDFILSELAQLSLGSSPKVGAENLFVTTSEDLSSVAASMVRKIGTVKLGHHLSWPVQNITRASSPDVHSKVLALLLQTNYIAGKLSRCVFNLRSESVDRVTVLPLRKNLLGLANTLQDHITTTSNVLHKEMENQLQLATDIDSMVAIWADYNKRLQTSLLLLPNLAPVMEAIITILELGDVLSTSEPRNVSRLQDQLQQQINFLVAGIRSVSRAGGEPALEVLAGRLDWSAG